MDKKKLFACILAVACLLPAAPALAGVSPYLGLGMGANSFDSNIHPVSGASLDDSDSGARFTLGIAFNDVVALELSRVDFGEAVLRGTSGGVFTLGNTAYQFNVDGVLRDELTTWAYGLVLSLPVNRLNGTGERDVFVPYVRAGFNSWDLDQSATFSGYTVTASDSGTNPWFGVGLDVRVTEHAGVRLGYDWFVVNDDDDAIDRITSLGLELMLRF